MKFLVKLSQKRLPPSEKKPLTAPQKQLREAKRKAKAEAERANQLRFSEHCVNNGLPKPWPEYKFAAGDKGRQWRIDFYFEHNGAKVALEVEGGVYKDKGGKHRTFGRHTTGDGYVKDMEKYNAMMEYGIKLHRVIPSMLYKDGTIDYLKKLLGLK